MGLPLPDAPKSEYGQITSAPPSHYRDFYGLSLADFENLIPAND